MLSYAASLSAVERPTTPRSQRPLRYHDFSLLRHIRWQQQLLQKQQQQVSFFTSTAIPRRNFFQSITAPFTNTYLKRLEREANDRKTDAVAQYTFLNALAEHDQHHAIVQRVRRSSPDTALDGSSALLYLRALQQTQQVQSLQSDDLLKRLQRTTGAVAPPDVSSGSKPEQLQQLATWLTTGGTGAAAAAGSLATNAPLGLSSRHPLHVQLAAPTSSLRSAVGSFVLRAALILVGVSAIAALLDERGLGRGGMGGGGLGGGSSKHVQEADGDQQTVRFADVKGVSEAKAELEEIVMYLRDPSRFTRLGGKLPRGLLLTGEPGTGKTLLAKAIAGEAGVPFFYSSGSQFEEVYVGLGAKRVRELFEMAKKKSPAIIFIDEIDAVGGTRKLKDQSALKMTLNELLVQLDGFDENNGIIVIGATNFMESLDEALLRPGRFDKHVTVPLPDVGGRKEILELYAKKTKLGPDADLSILARGTPGFSGADLFNLMNQAALKAAVDGLPHVTMTVLEYAKDKILMGAERKSAVITAETAKCTAYHEAGHALVAVLTPGAMPIHKATIIPRGNSLGMVMTLPDGDQTSQSLKMMLAQMDVYMGGRVAEELIFGVEEITSGASSDIMGATNIARNMVTKWGFSDEIGIVFHGGSNGKDSASEQTRAAIDTEVKRLTDKAYIRAKHLLETHKAEHKLLAETLLEYETLTGDEIRELVKKGVKPKRPAVPKSKKNPTGKETERQKRGLFGRKPKDSKE